MTDTTVKVFQSTDSGAPSLSGTAGALITLLDACLTNGYGSVTFDSVVIAGNVATCTKSTGHGFTAIGTVGPVIRMAGVSVPSALNADWRTTVVSSTVVTFATSGITDQTATGTITAKRAPLGFSKAFSGTNKAVYRADEVASTRHYLRVSDKGTGAANYARVRGYETMSDVDTGTGPFPTDTQVSGGGYWPKSSTADATARIWRLIGNNEGFALLVNYNGIANYFVPVYFGDYASEKAVDAYRAILYCGSSSNITAMSALVNIDSYTTSFSPRSYTQLGTSVGIANQASRQSNYFAYAGMDYPSPVGNQFYAAPVELWESATIFRGILSGIWCPLNIQTGLTDGMVVTDIPELSGHTLWITRCTTAGGDAAVAIDVTGPWR